MSCMKILTAAESKEFQPRMFLVNHAAGEKLSDAVLRWLDPIDVRSAHSWNLGKEVSTELHYHEHDEYWLWTKGCTTLTIRLPDGQSGTFDIGPGWVVYCVRGVEHGHSPSGDWGCYEFTGIRREGIREGHLTRSF